MKAKLVSVVLTLALTLSSITTVLAAPSSATCKGSYTQTTYVWRNGKKVKVTTRKSYTYTCPNFNWNTPDATQSGGLK